MSDLSLSDPVAEASPVHLISPVQQIRFPDAWYELTQPSHFWFQWRLAAAIGQIRETGLPIDQPLNVLEIGGGTGVLRDQLEASTSWIVDMTELNLEALRAARKGRGRNLYYDILEQRAAFVEAYDVVVLFDVLEHIEEPAPFLRAVLRHLKRGGHLLVNVPALNGLLSAYDRAARHFRRYDKRSLRAEFAGTDLVIQDLRYWGLTLVPLLMARKLAVRGGASSSATIRKGFQPPGRLTHGALRLLMRFETMACRHPPVGTSLLMAGRKG
jgi:2-polyprenyl-3-methyl-5-hydroxy-6-metoxy-1,4-benzoquinol methylase